MSIYFRVFIKLNFKQPVNLRYSPKSANRETFEIRKNDRDFCVGDISPAAMVEILKIDVKKDIHMECESKFGTVYYSTRNV